MGQNRADRMTSVAVEVWGPFALFTRPEFKVERASYDVPTPSACRGILDAIYWHPQMRWVIDRIHVLNEISHYSMKRNEVASKASATSALRAAKSGKPFYNDSKTDILQRNNLLLTNVRYVIEAHFELKWISKGMTETSEKAKIAAIVNDRIEKGKCFQTPCFGIREYEAHFKPAKMPYQYHPSLIGKRDLGMMLYDIDFSSPDYDPIFYHAVMVNGVIEVAKLYKEKSNAIAQGAVRQSNPIDSLIRLYERLAQDGRVPAFGWENVRVSYALDLSADGEIRDIANIKQVQESADKKGKAKPKPIPIQMELPAREKKGNTGASNFLCENQAFMFGVDPRKDPSKTRKNFETARKLHRQILGKTDSPLAKAILAFYDKYDFSVSDKLKEKWNAACEDTGNIVFTVEGEPAQNDPLIRKAWDDFYRSRAEGEESGVCMMTDEQGPIKRIHPGILGIRGGQTSGVSLVSFNYESVQSYGKERGKIAPMSPFAAYAYTAAINYLKDDQAHNHLFGTELLLFYGESGKSIYQDIIEAGLFCNYDRLSEQEYQDICRRIFTKGSTFDGEVDGNEQIHFLMLIPNAARLAIRMDYSGSLKSILKNIEAHHERVQMIRNDEVQRIPFWRIITEATPSKSKNPVPLPDLVDSVLLSIIGGTNYPIMLPMMIEKKFESFGDVTHAQIAILKGYFYKKGVTDLEQEKAYQAGRLFALECLIQEAALPGKQLYRKRFYGIFSTLPEMTFAQLSPGVEHYLAQIKQAWLHDKYEREYSLLVSSIGALPKNLDVEEQAAFGIGYHDRLAEYYSRPSDKNEENAEDTENE